MERVNRTWFACEPARLGPRNLLCILVGVLFWGGCDEVGVGQPCVADSECPQGEICGAAALCIPNPSVLTEGLEPVIRCAKDEECGDDEICDSEGACVTGERCDYTGVVFGEETCDLVDNDCDGEVDEGFPVGESCIAKRAGCESEGVYACRADRRWVYCEAPPPLPGLEFCNERDDDCDGLVDEDFDRKGEPCVVGEGACRRVGKLACSSDGLRLTCDAEAYTQDIERCGDGADNDCDGMTDEGFQDLGAPCLAGFGAQAISGTLYCEPGAVELHCEPSGDATAAPADELCNGVDDDGDGTIDLQLRQCETPCGIGAEMCIAGEWLSCSARKPSDEVCDYEDNDCDGRVDEGCSRSWDILP